MALSRDQKRGDRSIPKTNALQQDTISRIAAQGIEASFDDQVLECGSWTTEPVTPNWEAVLPAPLARGGLICRRSASDAWESVE
jgi:hypothetical protein